MLNLESPWLQDLEDHEKPVAAKGSKSGPSITVILDQPGESDDSFELASDPRAGKYKRTLGAKHAQALAGGAKVLRFDGVDAAQSYQLTHHRSKSSRRLVLPLTRFKDMTLPQQLRHDSEYVYFTLPSQVPNPLSGKYGLDTPVDPYLLASSPVLLDLRVEDPKEL
jgi:hypothetical protein